LKVGYDEFRSEHIPSPTGAGDAKARACAIENTASSSKMNDGESCFAMHRMRQRPQDAMRSVSCYVFVPLMLRGRAKLLPGIINNTINNQITKLLSATNAPHIVAVRLTVVDCVAVAEVHNPCGRSIVGVRSRRPIVE